MRTTKLRVGLAVVILMSVLGGTAAYASHSSFTDVPDSNGFHDNIDWMKQREITFGCNTAGTLYCPQANVTRAQMAAFMERLASTLSPRTLVSSESAQTGDPLIAGTTQVVCETSDYIQENWAETFHVTGDVTAQGNEDSAPWFLVTVLQVSFDSGTTWIPLTINTADEIASGFGVGTTASSMIFEDSDDFGGTPIRFGIGSFSDNPVDASYWCNLAVTIEHRYSNPTAGIFGGASDGSRFENLPRSPATGFPSTRSQSSTSTASFRPGIP